MRIYYTAEQIAAGVDKIAEKINAFYRDATDDAPVLVVCCLKGAAVFFADLVRRLDFPLETDFIRAASYGSARVSSGVVEISKDVETPVAGRRVLIVDDLVDSGRSLAALRTLLTNRGAADVRLAVAFDKKQTAPPTSTSISPPSRPTTFFSSDTVSTTPKNTEICPIFGSSISVS